MHSQKLHIILAQVGDAAAPCAPQGGYKVSVQPPSAHGFAHNFRNLIDPSTIGQTKMKNHTCQFYDSYLIKGL
jgi:hypothetical protein